MINLLEQLKEEADTLINLGDSKEKAKGRGMYRVISAIESIPPTYVLFGCEELPFVEESLQLVADDINSGKDNTYLIKFGATDTPSTIISTAMGCVNYAILTEEQYNEIESKLI